MLPAIFLDRDGVLIENVDQYVRSWADVQIFPESITALSRLKNSRWKLVMVTNQSVVGRGIITEEEAAGINNRVIAAFAQGGARIDGAYMCTHAPQFDCACRKPKPGLILQAARELSLDLAHSIMVGDALSDILAGQNAGVPLRVLVRTGRGHIQQHLPEAKSLQPYLTFDSLEAVVDALLADLLLTP